jgi:hypothetical protein
MNHKDKIQWLETWCKGQGVNLVLEGQCGFGRECVGISIHEHYPDYVWYDEETYDRADDNGDMFIPEDAYHKHDCVAVLGRGKKAEAQLYDWIKWFDENGFNVVTIEKDNSHLSEIERWLAGTHTVRMVKGK